MQTNIPVRKPGRWYINLDQASRVSGIGKCLLKRYIKREYRALPHIYDGNTPKVDLDTLYEFLHEEAEVLAQAKALESEVFDADGDDQDDEEDEVEEDCL